MLVPFADCFNHYNIDTGSEMFCPKLHQVSKIDITNPIYPAAMEYQTSERMIVEYGDFYKNHTSHREIKPSKATKDKMERKYNRYWKKVSTREKYLSRPTPDEPDKENKVSPLSILEEEKSKEIWNCSYSSSTDTEDDEDDSDEEVFDVVEEAVHSVKTSDGKIDRKYLLNVDERYAYKSTFDKHKRPLLIVQDRKQWKKRSFSCVYREREIRFDGLLDLYLEQNQEDSSSETSSDEEKETHGWISTYYDDSFFTLSTGKFKGYKPGEQVFNCYGSRSNKFLLFNYGFMMKHNPYNSMTFRAWVDHQIPDTHKITHIKGETAYFGDMNQVIRWFRVIHLKEKLNFKLLEYIRSTLIDKYTGKNQKILLISTPVDFDFETLVIGCAINLLESLLERRFTVSNTNLEEALLQKPKLSYRKKQIYKYRLDQKILLKKNLTMLQSKLFKSN